MSRKKRQSPRKRRNTPLSKHDQRGKTLLSPLGGLPNMRPLSWLRDHFPDYLWVCWHLSAGDLGRGRSIVVATMNRVNELLDEILGNATTDRSVLDGSLTSWESLPVEARASILRNLIDGELYELVVPEEFAQALGMYPDAPGSWLTAPWRSRDDFRLDPDIAEQALSAVIVASAGASDAVATNAKMLCFRAVVIAEKIKFARTVETVELLPRWPDGLTDDERAQAESFVRAAFGGIASMEFDDDESGRPAWARKFWRSNWKLFPCRVAAGVGRSLDAESVRSAMVQFTDRVNALWEQFESTAVATDPDLYDPDRYEVLSGVTARALRICSSAIRNPASWTLERSAQEIRALVEALITVIWLTTRNDPEMYRRFKGYGRGRLKMLKLHWEDFVDSLDEVPPGVAEHILGLDRMVNQDIDEEFQNIDLAGSFSGLDARKMAYEVGLEDEYRLTFAPSSSDAHGEWSHLDRYVLTRCVNATHRWHRVPRQSIVPAIETSVVDSMLDLAERVVERYTMTSAGSHTSGLAGDPPDAV